MYVSSSYSLYSSLAFNIGQYRGNRTTTTSESFPFKPTGNNEPRYSDKVEGFSCSL